MTHEPIETEISALSQGIGVSYQKNGLTFIVNLRADMNGKPYFSLVIRVGNECVSFIVDTFEQAKFITEATEGTTNDTERATA